MQQPWLTPKRLNLKFISDKPLGCEFMAKVCRTYQPPRDSVRSYALKTGSYRVAADEDLKILSLSVKDYTERLDCYFATKLTRRSGTTIVFMIFLPSSIAATFSSASAIFSKSSLDVPRGTLMRDLILPMI